MNKDITLRNKENTGVFIIINDSLKLTNTIKDNFK